jgi:cytidylate kinase
VRRRVVCISSATGAGGEEVAQLVAERLGLRIVDEAIVARAAQEAGVEHDVVADVERRKSFIAGLFRDLGTSAGFVAAGTGYPVVDEESLSTDDLRTLIRSAVEEAAAEGDAVIVSHAASIALSGREDVLRVLVTGSPEARAARVAATRGIWDDAPEKQIADSDAGREDYFRRFYDLRRELPTHYDLVVNTDRIDAQQAANLIADAAG